MKYMWTDVVRPLLASCSVPGALAPVRHGDWLLADGGITSLVPVHATREAGADVVIAVMVDCSLRRTLYQEGTEGVVYLGDTQGGNF